MTAGAAATGMRAWLIAHVGHLLTPARTRTLTVTVIAAGVLSASLIGPTPY